MLLLSGLVMLSASKMVALYSDVETTLTIALAEIKRKYIISNYKKYPLTLTNLVWRGVGHYIFIRKHMNQDDIL